MTEIRAYRRCHMCDEVCESSEKVRRCMHCGKPFTPFFYFDEQNIPVQAEGGLRAPDLKGQWRPIHGLSLIWPVD